MAFTLQRAAVVYSPLKGKFKSKKTAVKTVGFITLVGIIINLWVPFMFKIQTQSQENNNKQYCDIQKEYSKEYFQITIIYISLIMLIPIVVIFIGNSIIILSIVKANININRNFRSLSMSFTQESNSQSEFKRNKIETRSLTKNTSIQTRKDSKKITKMMIFISLSYAILNLPYFITWCLFFYGMAFKKITSISKNYMFATIQISEIFYILNYGIHFYIYSASGQAFRKNVISMFKC